MSASAQIVAQSLKTLQSITNIYKINIFIQIALLAFQIINNVIFSTLR